MSNIFRSKSDTIEINEIKKISIRNFHTPVDQDSTKELTLHDVLVERSRLLDEANKMIAIEKGLLENLRQTTADDITAMQQVWEKEKIELQQLAYDEGFQIGYEEGRNKAIAEMASSLQLTNEATEASHENALQYQASQERVILELAISAAGKIIGEEIEEDDGKFLAIIKRAIKETREMKEVKLYISLDYFDLISSNRAELASIFPPNVPFLIFVNEDFEATECYIETNHGRIVVSIDEQLNVLREKLIEIMESGD